MSWKNILVKCGIESKFLQNKHGPCPMCGGEDRFRYDDKDGNGNWFCNQCGSGNGFELIKQVKGLSFDDALKLARECSGGLFHEPQYDRSVGIDAKFKKAKDAVKKINETSVPAQGTIVEKYLQSRGLQIPEPFDFARMYGDEALVTNIQCVYGEDTFYDRGSEKNIKLPFMGWKVFYGSGDAYGFHRTLLDEHGNKSTIDNNKRLTSKMRESIGFFKGDYIYAPLTKGDNNIIILAEGIETALSAYQLMRDQHSEDCTTFSLINANGLEAFIPKSGGNHFMVFADRDDDSYAGQIAAAMFAKNIVKLNNRQFRDNKNTFRIAMPDSYEQDWNDILVNGTIDQKEVLPFNNWM